MEKIELLTKLAYQFGPFFFAVLINVVITRWAYKVYNGASRPDQVKTYRLYFMATAGFGIILIIASIAWWWTHQPFYLYRGVILDLKDYEKISSSDVYFRRVWEEVLDKDLPRIRKEHFIILKNESFSERDLFDISFSKGEGKVESLQLQYITGENPRFKIEWDANAKQSMLKPISQSSGTSSYFVTQAHAQLIAQQSTRGASGEALPKSTISPTAVDQRIVALLQNERTDVGNKIKCLDLLAGLTDSALAQTIEYSTEKEPMVLTLLDLTRHTDKELAFKAKRLIIEKYDLYKYFSRRLLSERENDRAKAKIVLFRMEPERAGQIVGRVYESSRASWLNPLRDEILSRKKSRVLVPTGSSQGDRFYVLATWDSKDQKTASCLTKLFNKKLESSILRTIQEETALMKNRSERLVYDYSKEWTLDMAERIEECKAKATFKTGY